jgi:uncharacterized delta-60 repeat protein
MRRLFNFLVVLVSIFLVVFSTQAQIDTSFGTNGRVITDLAQEDFPTKVRQSPNGKILVLSRGKNNGVNTPSFLTQYNSNGTIDASFGTNGTLQIIDPNDVTKNFFARDFVIQPDEKIIIVGQLSNAHSFITRLNSNGTIDTTFANNGFHYPIMSANGADFISYVKLQSDGRITTAGNGGSAFFSIFFIQYNSNGTLDSSFNGQGFTFAYSEPTVDKFFQQSNGKFLLASQLGCCTVPVLKRMNPDGSMDNTFATINLPTSSLSRIYLAADDKVYVATTEYSDYPNTNLFTNSRDDVAIYRYTANGTLDNTFGTNGKVKLGMAGYFNNNPYDLLVKPNGQIIIGTETNINNYNRNHILGRKSGIAKLESNGAISGRFIITDINSIDSQATQTSGKLALLSNGKIISVFSNLDSNLVVSQLNDVQNRRYNVRITPFSSSGNEAYPIVFRPSSSTFYYYSGGHNTFGNSTDIPFVTDFASSIPIPTTFRQNNQTWYFCNTCGYQWLTNGDIPVYSGDFDGDSRADFATFLSSNGVWSIKNSENGTNSFAQFGTNGDKPVAGDYDGDGRDDIAVWRPSNGYWYILNSSNNQLTAIPFGLNGDIPVAEDYDGDGRFDISVFRPSNGGWYRLNSSTNYGFFAVQWGISTDIPVPADYNGDGKADMAVYRDGYWYILTSDTLSYMGYYWGLPTDIPIPRKQ